MSPCTTVLAFVRARHAPERKAGKAYFFRVRRRDEICLAGVLLEHRRPDHLRLPRLPSVTLVIEQAERERPVPPGDGFEQRVWLIVAA